LSAYGLSKLVVAQFQEYVSAENPSVLAFAIHPGVVATDMLKDAFAPFAKDTPELVGGLATWLAGWKGPDRSFLGGRYITANWDVEDLVERKDEIVKENLLKTNLTGKFGEEYHK